MPANLLNLGNQFQVLLDDQYTSDNPGEELPNLGWDGMGWFGVWFQRDTDGHYWNPAESDTLEKSNMI